MKAFRIHEFGGPDSLRLDDVPDPAPGAGQVLVRMRAASLNYRDLMVAKGLYSKNLALPLIPLSDGAGEVIATGAGVSRVKVGDRVAGIFMQTWIAGELTDSAAKSALGAAVGGVLAEHVVLSEDGVVPIPDHLTFEEASTLPCAGVTAWHALFGEGSLLPGETVLIQGTGGVSLFALQFAQLAGARVIATSSSDEKLERVLALGASGGINYKTHPDWEKRALALTSGQGVDQVIEVGGSGTLGKSLRAVRSGGRISMIGVLSGGSGDVSLFPVLMKNVRVQGIFVGSRAMFESMNRAVSLHRLRPIVDRVFPFEQAPEALRYMESGAHFGKIVIRVGTAES
jgi:NADPH:quinone reductase-like Zn-dependent oxidoreductase